jgi:uncharacterized protein with HEPN domain
MIKKDDSVFIRHILDSIYAIGEFSKSLSREKLELDRLRQSAIVREIEIIGEASKNISSDFKEKHAEIPWKKIIGTRDKIIHHYFGVNLDIVWEILKKDLLDLKKELERINRS